MASEPAKQRREIVVINKTEGTVKDRWDIIERAVKILSLGAIPLLIADLDNSSCSRLHFPV